MLYPIVIEMGDESHSYGVVVPDVPGCFSAGDTLEEAFMNAKDAIAFHIEGMIEDGDEIPHPKSLSEHKDNPEYQGLMFAIVDVDLTHLMGKSEKINVTLPSLLIRRIDELVARNPEYKTRSGFLAQVATERIFAQG
ncbi:type II toxin-antitoxin system HicB family antitoxin [Actinobacillus equuli subsp. equuli]|uniref:Type II toxin-antitoxin system HicB family antitoxin n=1 Tax=Actinobacillus equuli subsp. equuli TaxID=202947 RepID=A0A9X4G486_ACTEU|nr:type II toxin-antitoxin system HicB family antitoxin [Actinobacillus equuli]MDE8035649.1 type II toxin-antitoxin system HicB family antitoxin [Actinobacillus equuli subsp. equuli]MDG4947720.1 type II toxin-antitoxin system HicB family antitoxin [Actinobacillus equuli subsp. haemolyticus]